MRRRVLQWIEEVRVAEGFQLDAKGGGRQFFGWGVLSDAVAGKMHSGGFMQTLLESACEADMHVVLRPVEYGDYHPRNMVEEWVVMLGTTWSHKAGVVLYHGSEVAKYVQQRWHEADVEEASLHVWARSVLGGQRHLNTQLTNAWRWNGRLDDATTAFAASAWAGMGRCGMTMYRWGLWVSPACPLCRDANAKAGGGVSKMATVDHILHDCVLGHRSSNGRGSLYTARHTGSRVLYGGTSAVYKAVTAPGHGWTVHTKERPCTAHGLFLRSGAPRFEHTSPDFFLVDNTDPLARDKRAVIIDVQYTRETEENFAIVRAAKEQAYGPLRKYLVEQGGFGGGKGKVHVRGLPLGVKGGIPAEFKEVMALAGVGARAAEALAAEVSANAIRDAKVIVNVWMAEAEAKARAAAART